MVGSAGVDESGMVADITAEDIAVAVIMVGDMSALVTLAVVTSVVVTSVVGTVVVGTVVVGTVVADTLVVVAVMSEVGMRAVIADLYLAGDRGVGESG
jgi:hypothetical protein